MRLKDIKIFWLSAISDTLRRLCWCGKQLLISRINFIVFHSCEIDRLFKTIISTDKSKYTPKLLWNKIKDTSLKRESEGQRETLHTAIRLHYNPHQEASITDLNRKNSPLPETIQAKENLHCPKLSLCFNWLSFKITLLNPLTFLYKVTFNFYFLPVGLAYGFC